MRLDKGNIQNIYDLTPLQSGILFIYLADPSARNYFIQHSFHFSGDVDIELLKKSFQSIIDRHDVLRSLFNADVAKKPVHVILKRQEADVRHMDISTDEDRSTVLSDIAEKDINDGFELNKGRLLRLTIVKTDTRSFQLIWSYHHILMDGWCSQVLIDEFFKIYSGLRAGKVPDLRPSPAYAEYVKWLDTFDTKKSFAYWRNYLLGYRERATLPEGFAQKKQGAHKPSELTVEFGVQRTRMVAEFCRREQITQSTFLQSVWGMLLGKYNNRNDVVFGAVVSGRPARVAGIERMVGLFINTIPVRIRWHEELTIRELFQNVQKNGIETEGHHYVQLAEVQANSEVGSDLIDHLMIFENFPAAEYSGNPDTGDSQDFRIEKRGTFEHTNYDFEIVVQPGQDLKLKLSYNAALYRSTSLELTGKHLLRVVDTALDTPRVMVSAVSYISEEEAGKQALVNSTTSQVPQQTIVSAFREAARMNGGDVAITCEGRSITFDDLNAATDRVAANLVSRYGITRGEVVGIMLDRSLELVIGIISIMKSGAAYLPIEAQYPEERISFMIKDSSLRTVLSSDDHSERLMSEGVVVAKVIDLVAQNEEDVDFNSLAPQPDDAAYVIYTSGSTGMPKGVLIEHRNVINFFLGIDQAYSPSANDVMLAVTGVTFDISVLELLWTLTRGVAVVLHTGDIQWLDRFLVADRNAEFSLFYFSTYNNESLTDKYDLLLDSVRFADEQGFAAVWTPERHFHEFGGLFPNPSVLSSALAAITSRLQIRAGSVVLPLHDPIRVAEEWSVVDNLSDGRAGVSFASGWNPNDFTLASDSFGGRQSQMYEKISVVQHLWSGGKVTRKNGQGTEVEVGIFPEPIQKNIPVWITSTGNKETFISAGAMGANILTHLLGQDIDELAENIRLYRESRARNGFDPDDGKVSLMVHTYIGRSETETEEETKEAFIEYLRSSAGLSKVIFENEGLRESVISPDLKNKIFENAYRRYAKDNSLIGTIDQCSKRVMMLKNIGVDEFACLIDFGVKPSSMKEGLLRLNEFRKMFSSKAQARSITMMQTTPVFLKAALDDDNSFSFLKSLKTILVGGDVLSDQLEEELHEKLPATKFNMYGPTETTIWSTFSRLNGSGVTIGKPMANTQVYLVDDNNVPVGQGVLGNIFIAGSGVSRGYLNRPDLTSERFVANPWSPGSYMYRTGDIGRWNSNWDIEFFGRSDFQIKLRGHRIEPGEVEFVLKKHADVDEAIVAQKKVGRDNALVAYVVCRSEDVLKKLQSFVSESLPPYMVPSHFVRLDSLPLTHNGKIDRSHLPDPELKARAHIYCRPVNTTEEQLINIWQDILERSPIGTDDNFFELGGHSLKVVQLISRIRKDFGVQVDVQGLFDHVTISTQAELISRSKRALLEIIPAAPPAESYQLSHAQHRFWILSQFDEGSLSYIDSAGLRLKGILDIDALQKSIDKLVERHESLRTVFREIGGDVRQVILDASNGRCRMVFEDASIHNDKEAFLRDIYSSEQRSHFDLSVGPLLRVRVVKLTKTEHVLFYSMHHLISDGWSMEIIAREITRGYNTILRSETQEREPLRINYKDYASWQRRQLESDLVKDHEKFWLEHLAGELPVLELPTGRGRRAVLTHNGASFARKISDEDVTALRSTCVEEGATLFMGLLALTNAFFYRITRQDDFIIGSPVAGREHPELEDQIGLYLNTLPIRTRVHGEEKFADLLKRVRSTVLNVYAHQIYPFDVLVEKIGVERDMSRSALFDVLIVLQNQTTTNIFSDGKGFEGITVSQIDGLERSTSRFDLEFSFMESGQGLTVEVIYNTDLYERTWLEKFFDHFLSFIRKILAVTTNTLNNIDLIDEAEISKIVKGFNNTDAPYPDQVTLVDLFKSQVKKNNGAPAIHTALEVLSYAQLDHESDNLASQLIACDVAKGDIIGLMVDRSPSMMIGIWGILKAGAAYIPIDPQYPLDRTQYMLSDSNAKIVVTDAVNFDRCERLQWQIPGLKYLIELGHDNNESYDTLEQASRQLWNHVAEGASNDVAASGWKNSYTLEIFSDAEIEDLVSNVCSKVLPHISKEAKVLEVGCGSGLVLYRLAPLVKSYTATDLSDSVLDRVLDRVTTEGLTNVSLHQLSASGISKLDGQRFDFIIVNSVVQYFPSYRYLRAFLDQATNLLSENGMIFLGDIRDQDQQDEFYRSCYSGEVRSEEINRRRMLETELFVSRKLLDDYCLKLPYAASVSHSKKNAIVENELTRYRFDAIIEVRKKRRPAKGVPAKIHITGTTKHQSNARISHRSKPDDLAYVIYTSGSTGKPKGVMIDHRGAVNRIHWMWNKYQFDRSDVILQKTTYVFDVSVWEIFMTHCFGASMALCSREDVYDTAAIVDLVWRYRVTTMHFVPSMFQVFLDQVGPKEKEKLRSLKKIFASGEALPPHLSELHHQKLGIPLHNLYGPTEASVDVTFYETTGMEAVIPIGKPIDNMRMYILDDRLKTLPICMPGELYIEGVGLARGYLNQPELTVEKFIESPFVKGQRIYHTGDIARWLEDGNIEFLGRRDHQVKVRGYRIELNEIENTIVKSPGMVDAKVIVWKDAAGANELAAYLVATLPVDLGGLRRWLALYLPEYMVPASFVQLDKFPLTQNGKLNRKLLPDPHQSSIRAVNSYEPPRNYAEEKLVSVWEELLGRDSIGINDNFFELGGDSIKSVQASSRLRKYGLFLKVSDILQFPVLHEAASKVLSDHDDGEASMLSVITPFQLAKMQVRHEPFVILRLNAGQDITLINNALLKVIRRHETLRTSFVKENGQWSRKLNDVDHLEIPVHELTGGDHNGLLSDKNVSGFVNAAVDPSRPIQLRPALFTSGSRNSLIIACPEFAVDHYSWSRLLRELSGELDPTSDNDEDTLSNGDHYHERVKAQYRSFKTLSPKAKSYWQEIAGQPSEIKTLNSERGDVSSYDFEIRGKMLTLVAEVNASYLTTIQELVLSGVGICAREMFRSDRIVIANENNLSLENESDIGCYSITYPLQLNTNFEDLSELLLNTRETCRRVPGNGSAYGYFIQSGSDVTPLSMPILCRFDSHSLDLPHANAFGMEYDGRSYWRERLLKYPIEVNCYSDPTSLKIDIRGCDDRFGPLLQRRLNELIRFCANARDNKITPTDLGDMEMTIDTLDNLFE